MPREDAVGVRFVEQASPVEVAQHATLDDVLKLVPMLGSESGDLTEAGLGVVGL